MSFFFSLLIQPIINFLFDFRIIVGIFRQPKAYVVAEGAFGQL